VDFQLMHRKKQVHPTQETAVLGLRQLGLQPKARALRIQVKAQRWDNSILQAPERVFAIASPAHNQSPLELVQHHTTMRDELGVTVTEVQ
jgi:hypothetical protein